MPDVNSSFKSLISSIYECHKKIISKRHIIHEFQKEGDGNDTTVLQNEIQGLKGKITKLQKTLKDKYHCSRKEVPERS